MDITIIIITNTNNKHPGQGEREGILTISTSTTAGRLSLHEQEPLCGLIDKKKREIG